MKKNYLIAIFAAAAVTAAALAGCGSESTQAPAAPESSAAASAETPAEGSSAPESAAESEDDSSTAAPSADFEAVFAENKLDSDYETQMGTAYSTREIVSVANTFAGLWKTEISNAYTQLLEADSKGKAEIEADQKNWNDNLQSELDRIRAAAGGDGSENQVTQATAVKDFYREKAKALYEKLYAVKPDFTYAYAPY